MSELYNRTPIPESRVSQDQVKDMYSLDGILGVSEEELVGYNALTGSLSALISGLPKVGKTTLLGTSTLPLLIYSWDPKSTVVLWNFYPHLMEKQWIIVLPFWDEGGYENPKMYDAWERVYENHLSTGFLHRFATVAKDSYSGWLNAAGNKWLHYKNEERLKKPGGKSTDHLAQGDYPGLYNLSSKMIHQLAGGDWNFLMTCHLNVVRDEDSGVDLRTELMVYKSLKGIIPRLFSENYILLKEPTGPGQVEYQLLTDKKGIYEPVGSQLRGDGKLAVKEEANLRALFKKAGVRYEDKPHWKTGETLSPDDLPERLRKYL